MNERKRNWNWKLPFLLFLIVGSIYIIRTQTTDIPFQKEEGSIFGTFYHVTYQCDSSLQQDITAALQSVDRSLSPFNKSSIISQVNRNETTVPDSFFTHIFRLSQQVSEETEGAFDITVAPLVNAWGFGFKNEASVTPQLIDSLLQFVGYEKIRWEDNGVVKSDPRIILDCSAIAKGFGSDVVADLFDRKGIRNYMVEIGGEIVVRGHNPKDRKWHVGVSKPIEDSLNVRQQVQTILEVTDLAMATSGNYRNFYYKEGKRYAHTIDPRTGYPVEHSLLSATVLADDCATADAYATAFMVLGLEKSKVVLEAHPELHAYLIYTDGDNNHQVYTTPNMEGMLPR